MERVKWLVFAILLLVLSFWILFNAGEGKFPFDRIFVSSLGGKVLVLVIVLAVTLAIAFGLYFFVLSLGVPLPGL